MRGKMILQSFRKVANQVRFLKSEKGIAIPLVLIVMVVLFLLGTALWYYSVSELKQVARAEDKARAYYVARSGAETLARHIMLNPAVVEDILNGAEINISDIITLETEYLGDAGDMSVSLEKLAGDELEITGIGVTNGIQETVRIILELKDFPSPDAVVVTTGSHTVDFNQHMTVEGSIVAGGDINLPNDYDPNNEYTVTPNYQFPEDYFMRVVVPEDPDNYESEIKIKNGDIYEIPNGKHYEVGYLTIEGGGTLQFVAEEGSTTILVVNDLNLKNNGVIKIIGTGTVQIYLRTVANIHSPHIIFPPDAQLHFYLDEGCDLILSGNVEFDGLIYGPYDTHVMMQSNGSINGALIVEKLTGAGGGNIIGGASAALTYYEGFGEIGFLPIVNMLYWKP